MKRKTIKGKSGTDWGRLATMSDAEIDRSDIRELDAGFFESAEVRLPRSKKAVSLRLDPDVIAWFKHQGKGYQTRINAVLRMYMEAKSSR